MRLSLGLYAFLGIAFLASQGSLAEDSVARAAPVSPSPGIEASNRPTNDFSIQVGAYQSLRRASVVQSILANLAPAEVQRMSAEGESPLYRVLVGRFKTSDEAKAFIEQYRFRRLFPDLWVNPVQVDSAPYHSPLREELDPYQLQVSLYCEKDRKFGQYQAQFTPEPGEKRSSLDVDLNWACYPDAPLNWRLLEQELRPSHLYVSPLVTFGSLTGENAGGSFERFGFGTGIQVGAFKNFGPIGPVLEYRLLRQRYSTQGIIDFLFKHTVSTGVRLPVAERLFLEPSFSFDSQHFLADTGYVAKFLPEIGLKGSFRFFEPRPKSTISFIGGLRYLFSSTTAALAVHHGLKWSAGLRARHYSDEGWGGDWYMEYSSQTRDGLTVKQNESAFTVGVTLLLIPDRP